MQFLLNNRKIVEKQKLDFENYEHLDDLLSLLKEPMFFIKRINFDPVNEGMDQIDAKTGKEGLEKRRKILHKLYDMNKLS